MFIRDNENRLAVIESRNDFVHNCRIDEHIDEREHRGSHAEEERCNEHDEAVHREENAAHMQVIVFTNDGSEDVKSPRTAVHTKDKPVAKPCKDTAVYGGQHHIGHGRICVQRTRQVKEERKDRRTDDDIDRVRLPHQSPRHEEQWDIIDERLKTDGQPKDIVDDHCNARCTSCEEMRRNEKEID